MNKLRTEIRVNDIVDHVVVGGKVEDNYVEAKAEWPDPQKVARQLAGMANAAGGQPILWLIGLSEDQHKVVETGAVDPANWWAQVESKFAHDVAPGLNVLNVPTDHGRVVCLEFETDRAPYLVKTGGTGTATTEVPWRTGTRTRTATRSELLSLLKAAAAVPELTLVDPVLSLAPADKTDDPKQPETKFGLILRSQLFVDSPAASHLFLPSHRWSASVTDRADLNMGMELSFSARRHDSTYGVTESGHSGIFVLGPDVVGVIAYATVSFETAWRLEKNAHSLDMNACFPINGTSHAARFRQTLFLTSPTRRTLNDGWIAHWRATSRDDHER